MVRLILLVMCALLSIAASTTASLGQTTRLNPNDVVLDARRSWVNEARHEVALVFRVRSAYRAQFNMAQFRKIVRPFAKHAACRLFREAGKEFAYLRNGGTIHVEYRDKVNAPITAVTVKSSACK